MGNCSCLYGGEGESPSFHSEDIVKARRAHRCSECGRDILPGATYERVSGKWEGDVSTFKTCADCREIRAALYCGGSWIYGCLWDDIREQLFGESHGLTIDCIDKLTTASAKAYLQQQWIEFMGLTQ